MKHLKSFLVFTLICFAFSCSSDDSSSTVVDSPAVTLDITSVVALPPGSDITNLVSFNGQNAGTYTSELDLGKSLRVGRPDGLQSGVEFVYTSFVIFLDTGTELIELEIDETTFTSSDGNLQFVIPEGQPSTYFEQEEVEVFEIRAINNDVTDIDYKYNIEVYITRNDIEFGPYLIDPKIRVKSLN